jgi:glutathione S-transferase
LRLVARFETRDVTAIIQAYDGAAAFRPGFPLGREQRRGEALQRRRVSLSTSINPNRKIPALVDGATVMWESLAINLYLAQTHTTELSPRGRAELGDALKWTLWAQSELEEFFNRTASLDAVPPEWARKTLGVLETTLQRRAYLTADRFTVADLNVSCMFFGPVSSQLSLDTFPSTQRWRNACWARPACARALREALDPACP